MAEAIRPNPRSRCVRLEDVGISELVHSNCLLDAKSAVSISHPESKIQPDDPPTRRIGSCEEVSWYVGRVALAQWDVNWFLPWRVRT